ncbi:MAG: hypothetical protein ACREOZ_01780 [Gloeomargaritales cyanobacterium]
MHSRCGTASDKDNERYCHNNIEYAYKCHLCDSSKTKATRASLQPTVVTRNQGSGDGNPNCKRSSSNDSLLLNLPPPAKKVKRGGVLKGSKRVDRPQAFLREGLCRTFVNGRYSSRRAFLNSADSGADISVKRKRSFNRALQKFNNGTLMGSTEVMRDRKSYYEPIKKMLLEYVDLRAQLYQRNGRSRSQWRQMLQKKMTILSMTGKTTNMIGLNVLLMMRKEYRPGRNASQLLMRRKYFASKEANIEAQKIERVVACLRAQRLTMASSQLSIHSFFK